MGEQSSRTGTPWGEERIWEAVRVERARLATDLAPLPDDAWTTPSQCSEWTVEQALAHLTAVASIGRMRWIRSVLGARFDFDLHNRRRLTEHLGSTPRGTLERFVAVVENRVGPSRATWAWLGEVVVHSTDIRVPLGLTTEPDPAAVALVARRFATKDFAVPSRTTARGVELVATDVPFRHGEGPTVSGKVLDLVMVLSGRQAHLPALSGPGVSLLADRLAGSPS